jgi:hypothetical protein
MRSARRRQGAVGQPADQPLGFIVRDRRGRRLGRLGVRLGGAPLGAVVRVGSEHVARSAREVGPFAHMLEEVAHAFALVQPGFVSQGVVAALGVKGAGRGEAVGDRLGEEVGPAGIVRAVPAGVVDLEEDVGLLAAHLQVDAEHQPPQQLDVRRADPPLRDHRRLGLGEDEVVEGGRDLERGLDDAAQRLQAGFADRPLHQPHQPPGLGLVHIVFGIRLADHEVGQDVGEEVAPFGAAFGNAGFQPHQGLDLVLVEGGLAAVDRAAQVEDVLGLDAAGFFQATGEVAEGAVHGVGAFPRGAVDLASCLTRSRLRRP